MMVMHFKARCSIGLCENGEVRGLLCSYWQTFSKFGSQYMTWSWLWRIWLFFIFYFSWWHLFFVEKCYLVLVLRINTHWCIYICTTFIIWFCGKNIEQKNKGLGRLHGGAKVQVTGQVTGHRSGHRPQATGHRPQVRSQVTQKTIGHWTKLFWTDVLLYKNKISQGTLMIFLSFKQY